MTFGRDVASDILMSYPGNDVVMIISRLLFGISIITIYPIILLLGRWVTPEFNCVVVEFLFYYLTCCLCVCVCLEQICHPELDAARSKTSPRNRHSFVWESLQSRSHCDLDSRHSSHRHVCPWHGWGHQCHWRNQRLLHLYFSRYVNNLYLNISVRAILYLACLSFGNHFKLD